MLGESQDACDPATDAGSADALTSASARHYALSEDYAAYEVVAERATQPFATVDDAKLLGAAR